MDVVVANTIRRYVVERHGGKPQRFYMYIWTTHSQQRTNSNLHIFQRFYLACNRRHNHRPDHLDKDIHWTYSACSCPSMVVYSEKITQNFHFIGFIFFFLLGGDFCFGIIFITKKEQTKNAYAKMDLFPIGAPVVLCFLFLFYSGKNKKMSCLITLTEWRSHSGFVVLFKSRRTHKQE